MKELTTERIDQFFYCMPYLGFYFSPSLQHLFYFKKDQGKKHLMWVKLTGSYVDLTQGESVVDFDFQNQSVFILEFREAAGDLLVVMDAGKTENYNVFSIHMTTREIRQITHFAQVISPRVSLDQKSLWCTERRRDEDNKLVSTLYKVNIESGEKTFCFDDAHLEYKLNFSSVIEGPNGQIYLFLDENYQRHFYQLFEFSNDFKVMTPCLEPSTKKCVRYFCYGRSVNGLLYFVDDSTGFYNVYSWDCGQRKVVQRTHSYQKNQVGVFTVENEVYFFVCIKKMKQGQSSVEVLDFHGQRVHSQELDCFGQAYSHEHSLWFRSSGMESPPRLNQLFPRGIEPIDLVQGDPSDLMCGTREIHEYASFDGLKIHSFLYLPKGPIRAGIVIAFYGGDDFFDPSYQLFLDQGIAILSPAVRGSWGWGREWENHLRGDLGGSEILDVIWGAKFLAAKCELSPQQIGVQGGSHGGYSVLRTVTMPPIFKGVSTHFDFGFGICWAGFADLEVFSRDSWISDWLTDLLGPIGENRELYRDRSPLHHIEQLRTPLFITHGKNDRRVPISTMTDFIEKLPSQALHHEVLIQEGEGHAQGSVDKNRELQLRLFAFINRCLQAKGDSSKIVREV